MLYLEDGQVLAVTVILQESYKLVSTFIISLASLFISASQFLNKLPQNNMILVFFCNGLQDLQDFYILAHD